MGYLSSIWVESDKLIPKPSSKYLHLVLNPHQPHCTTLVLQLFYLGWIEKGSGISSKIHLGIISFTSEALWFKRKKNKVIFIHSMNLHIRWIIVSLYIMDLSRRVYTEHGDGRRGKSCHSNPSHGDDNEKKKVN